MTHERFEVRTEDVLHERLDGETIIVNMRTGRYLSLKGPASDIWYLIAQGVPRMSWLNELSHVWPRAKETDVESFVTKLVSQELIRRSETSLITNPIDWPADMLRDEWVLEDPEEFDDLADLILIDPVHDVDEEGWPKKKGS